MAKTTVPIELSSTPGIVDNSNATAITIDSSENVGIGTGSPSSIAGFSKSVKLEDASSASYVVSGGTDEAEFAVSSTGGWFGTSTNVDQRFVTNNIERMRINSSGHLLVGTTDESLYDDATDQDGHNILANGQYYNSTVSEINMILNRQNSDGDILQFRKDGSTVGSIGSSYGDRIHIGTGNTGVMFRTSSRSIDPADTSTGLITDNVIDLGRSGSRFKDLYLSGGAYLGGTGSANYLDDYEEGTFTPTLIGATTAGTPSYGFRKADYTKVGNLVHFNINIVITAWSGSPAGEVRITGLPFTSAAGDSSRGYAPVSTMVMNYSGYTMTQDAYVQPSTDYVRFGDLTDASADAAFEIRIAGTYRAA